MVPLRTSAAGEVDPAVRKSILTTLFISLLLDLVCLPPPTASHLAPADNGSSCPSR